MSEKSPVVSNSNALIQTEVDSFSASLQRYLNHLGLPSDNVLVEPAERLMVIKNLPDIVGRLSPEVKAESMYISKFVAACGAGLFDAALNMLWNEVVVNLRDKVTRFDMDYFLDSVVTDSKRRATFKTEDDLKKLDEWELIKGCKDTGIITEIGYKHLDYIRDMRNHASAAHPNHNDLDGLQLSSWLQTCIKEVLAKEPEGPVLEVKRLLHNLRTRIISPDDVPPIKANIQRLPVDLIDSTLRAVFGMYTSPDQDVQVRNNLKLIVPSLWANSSKQAKRDAGFKYATFSANAELDRKQLAYEFLTIVDGLAFLPNDQRALEMDIALDSLLRAHYGWNNFHNEPSHARVLASFVPSSGDIPDEVNEKYVKVLTLCTIGNGYGVSTSAYDYYVSMINKFSEKQYYIFVLLLWDIDVQSRLGFRDCEKNFKALARDFSAKTLNANLKNILNAIVNATNPLSKAHLVTAFKQAVENISL